MNTCEQRAAIGAGAAAIAIGGLFALSVVEKTSTSQLIALCLFSVSVPAHLLFALIQLNSAVENNPRNSIVSTWSFWPGQATLFLGIAICLWGASSAAAACFVISVLVALWAYGYAAKTDGRKA